MKISNNKQCNKLVSNCCSGKTTTFVVNIKTHTQLQKGYTSKMRQFGQLPLLHSHTFPSTTRTEITRATCSYIPISNKDTHKFVTFVVVVVIFVFPFDCHFDYSTFHTFHVTFQAHFCHVLIENQPILAHNHQEYLLVLKIMPKYVRSAAYYSITKSYRTLAAHQYAMRTLV